MAETAVLSRYVADTSFSDVPSAVRERAKTLVRDVVGVALYGSQQEVGDLVTTYVNAATPGEIGTVMGRETANPMGAAFANGIFSHTADYDDTFESIVLHPSSPVFPAALAAAEHAEASGKDLLTGYVVGVDTALAVGRAMFPSHYDHGWHATGTIGSIGAAAAAASVLQLSDEEVRNAFGIVGSCASSLLKNAGTMTKSLHAGHAAEMGMQAALLANGGFTADQNILDGQRGYGSVMTSAGTYDPAVLISTLEEEWAVMDVGIKPYACGRIQHSSLEALRTLLVREELEAEDVTSVRVTLDTAAEKILTYTDPIDAFEAKASIELPHAAVLLRRRAGVNEFTEGFIRAEETRAQMRKIERQFEENLFDGGYGGYGGRVEVETTDGRSLEVEQRQAIGSPENPLTESRLKAKFEECAGAALSASEVQNLATAIDELDERDVEGLLATVQPVTSEL